MTELLPPLPLLLAFLGASLLLAATPGPGVVYIVTRCVTEGRAAGLSSVLGVALGNLVNAIAASLGLAALLAASSVAFEFVRYAGALYLFFLGWMALRPRALQATTNPHEPGHRTRRVVLDGFVVALLNPKTALFFAAFLPQFVPPGQGGTFQPLSLAALFVAIAAVTDTLYALFASAIAANLKALNSGRFLAGGAYLSIGLLTALTGNRGNP